MNKGMQPKQPCQEEGPRLHSVPPKSSRAGGVPHVVCLLWLMRSPGGWD